MPKILFVFRQAVTCLSHRNHVNYFDAFEFISPVYKRIDQTLSPSSWSKEQIWAYFVSFADLP